MNNQCTDHCCNRCCRKRQLIWPHTEEAQPLPSVLALKPIPLHAAGARAATGSPLMAAHTPNRTYTHNATAQTANNACYSATSPLSSMHCSTRPSPRPAMHCRVPPVSSVTGPRQCPRHDASRAPAAAVSGAVSTPPPQQAHAAHRVSRSSGAATAVTCITMAYAPHCRTPQSRAAPDTLHTQSTKVSTNVPTEATLVTRPTYQSPIYTA